MAKGFQGRAKNCYNIARNRVRKSLQHAFKGRKIKKRDARKLWIQKINAGSREHNLAYSQLISGMNKNGIELNRKVLAELAVTEPYTFKSIVSTVQSLGEYDNKRSIVDCKRSDLYISKPKEWPTQEEMDERKLAAEDERGDPGYPVRKANRIHFE